jgi:hypothetical protein
MIEISEVSYFKSNVGGYLGMFFISFGLIVSTSIAGFLKKYSLK